MGLTEKHWFDDELTTISQGNLRRLFRELEELHREVAKMKQDAKAERKGKWIKDFESKMVTYPYRCMCCNKYSRAMYDFCPNCGADMRGEER